MIYLIHVQNDLPSVQSLRYTSVTCLAMRPLHFSKIESRGSPNVRRHYNLWAVMVRLLDVGRDLSCGTIHG